MSVQEKEATCIQSCKKETQLQVVTYPQKNSLWSKVSSYLHMLSKVRTCSPPAVSAVVLPGGICATDRGDAPARLDPPQGVGFALPAAHLTALPDPAPDSRQEGLTPLPFQNVNFWAKGPLTNRLVPRFQICPRKRRD